MGNRNAEKASVRRWDRLYVGAVLRTERRLSQQKEFTQTKSSAGISKGWDRRGWAEQHGQWGRLVCSAVGAWQGLRPKRNKGGGRRLTPPPRPASCMSVFPLVPLTEKLLLVVLNSTILVIQEDLKPVSRMAECSGWEGNCCFEKLGSGKMERGRFGGMKRQVRHPCQATSGLRLFCPWVTFGLVKTWERFEKWTGGSFIFSEPFWWAVLWWAQ